MQRHLMASSPNPLSPAYVPPSLSWYCNAAHITPSVYTLPPQAENGQAKLVNLIYVQRHQKRTPDNLVPNNENVFNPPAGWDCRDINFHSYATGKGVGAANVVEEFEIDSWNPFLARIWNGTCDAGQLTAGGLKDSRAHGKDFWDIYGPAGKAHFLGPAPTEEQVYVRTSPEPRTMQVAGAWLDGAGYQDGRQFTVHVMPSEIDNIVPSYSCSYADSLRSQIESEQPWKEHLASKQSLFDDVNAVLGTGQDGGWNSWIDHAFDFLSSRQCHDHPLPTNPANGKSISQKTADDVYAEGNWEYNYIWNNATNADEYVKYQFGGFVQELGRKLDSIRSGHAAPKLTAYFGHDGTMVRLFKTLAQAGDILWPGLGSEVVFEVWQDKAGSKFMRILAYGKVLSSNAKGLTTKDGPADAAWTPLDDVIQYLEGRVPGDLFEKCSQ